MSLSDYIVCHMFYMNFDMSETGMLSFISYSFLVLATRNVLRAFIFQFQLSFYLSCSLEGKKNTVSSKTSLSFTWDLFAGLGILFQASSTLATNFCFKASGFSFFSTKSLTTKTICFGLSEPNSFKLSYKMIYKISNWAPLKVPIC